MFPITPRISFRTANIVGGEAGGLLNPATPLIKLTMILQLSRQLQQGSLRRKAGKYKVTHSIKKIVKPKTGSKSPERTVKGRGFWKLALWLSQCL